MATGYSEDGSRVGLDGGSIAWQAACETSVTDWDKTDQVIFSANCTTSAHVPPTESFKLQWRNVSDSGTFADLVTGSGELRAGTSAGAITNGDPVASQDGCGTGTMQDSEEVENESPLQTGSLAETSKTNHIEMQWCIDFSNAVDEKEYAFQLYSVTGLEALGECTSTITTAAAAAAIPKGFADSVTGSDVFAKVITLLSKTFADAIAGADVFEIVYRAMGFADTIEGADVFETLYREMEFVDAIGGSDVWTVPWKLLLKAFVDAIAGADVFTLTRPIYFSDSGGGSDVFTQPYREMEFADVIAGSDVFSIPFRAMGWADTGTGTEVFFLLSEVAFADTVTGTDVFTVPLKVIAVAFVDTGIGTDVFIIPYREMGFSDTLTGADIFELLRFLAFVDAGSGSDAYSVMAEMGFSDAVLGSDAFATPYREMGFSDVGAGVEVFTTPYKEMEFADVALGTDVFASAISGGVIEKFTVDTGHGLETFTHIIDMCPVDTIHGLDIFLVTKPEIILRITDEDFAQILITDGSLNQVKITWSDI